MMPIFLLLKSCNNDNNANFLLMAHVTQIIQTLMNS